MWEMDALRCTCPGCDRCYVWLSDGPGCTQNRAKAEKCKLPEDMRCVQRAAFRDAQSSTGSDSTLVSPSLSLYKKGGLCSFLIL